MSIDPIIFMQAEIANLFMERRNISPIDFLKLDEEYNILEFIKEGYEIFHLMGDEGILNEINDYIDAA